MANNKKRISGNLTAASTIPTATSTAVTITAASGDDLFTLSAAITDDFGKGAWIFDETNLKLYKVKEMRTSTVGKIWGTFDNTLSTDDINYIKVQDAKIVKMYVQFVAAGSLDGNDYAEGDSVNLESLNVNAKYGARFVDAAYVTGTDINYVIEKY